MEAILEDLIDAIAADDITQTVVLTAKINEDPPENYISDFNPVDLTIYSSNESFRYMIEHLEHPRMDYAKALIFGVEIISTYLDMPIKGNEEELMGGYVEYFMNHYNPIAQRFLISFCILLDKEEYLQKLKDTEKQNDSHFCIDLGLAVVRNDVNAVAATLKNNNPDKLITIEPDYLTNFHKNNDAIDYIIAYANFAENGKEEKDKALTNLYIKNPNITKEEIRELISTLDNPALINRLAYFIQDFNLLVREEE